MARKVSESVPPAAGFAICISYDGGVSGFLTGEAGKVIVWPTEAEAEKALKKLTKNAKYSWNCHVKVEKYDEKRRDVKQ